MAITHSEILDGASYEYDSKGLRTNRIFMVTVDDSVPDTSVLYTAATTPGIPQYGDHHPTLTNLIATSTKAEPFTKSCPRTVKVTVTYEFDYDHSKGKPTRNGKATLTFGTTMTTVKSGGSGFGGSGSTGGACGCGMVSPTSNSTGAVRPETSSSFLISQPPS